MRVLTRVTFTLVIAIPLLLALLIFFLLLGHRGAGAALRARRSGSCFEEPTLGSASAAR